MNLDFIDLKIKVKIEKMFFLYVKWIRVIEPLIPKEYES